MIEISMEIRMRKFWMVIIVSCQKMGELTFRRLFFENKPYFSKQRWNDPPYLNFKRPFLLNRISVSVEWYANYLPIWNARNVGHTRSWPVVGDLTRLFHHSLQGIQNLSDFIVNTMNWQIWTTYVYLFTVISKMIRLKSD